MLQAELLICERCTAGRLWTILSTVLISWPASSISLNPPKKYLVGKKFATDEDVEQTDTSSLEAPYTDFLYGEIQNLGATLQ